ncbi:MAG: MFS transporter [Candidatus Nanopelagicales bacterium]|nr:MFS transporter [Candidatus Nanopelagicales bacterium]
MSPKQVVMRKLINRELDESVGTRRQKRMWGLAASGIGLDGYDLFIMSAAIPLLKDQFDISTPALIAWLGGAAVVGAIPGAVISGILADRFGRQIIMRVDVLVFALTAVLCALAWNPVALVVFRLIQGFAIGAEYPMSAAVVAENLPRRNRGKWMTAAFGFQALGMALAAGVATLALLFASDEAWRWMFLSGLVPAVVVGILRQRMPEGPRWLARQGRMDEAIESLEWLLGPSAVANVQHGIGESDELDEAAGRKGAVRELLTQRFRRRTALVTLPWFLMDIALYGVGMFTPMILLVLFASGVEADGSSLLQADIEATASAALADVFLMLGFIVNILLVERLGRIKLQVAGFIGMAVGTMTVALTAGNGGSVVWAVIGFMIFNLMLNTGPNATTYLLPAEVYPTRLRTTGHGIAAAFGKLGATVGVFLLPAALDAYGLSTTMIAIALVALIGAVVTLVCRVETRGLALE